MNIEIRATQIAKQKNHRRSRLLGQMFNLLIKLDVSRAIPIGVTKSLAVGDGIDRAMLAYVLVNRYYKHMG